MPSRDLLLLFVAGAACFGGCGDASAPPALERAAPVTNATPAPDDPAVVGLVLADEVFCTGTLIAPRVVLTAGHCVDGVYGQGDLDVYFGSRIEDGGIRIRVADIHQHPDYDRQSLGNDLALLHLVDPAPAGTTPIPILDRSLDPWEGTEIRLVGFGFLESTDRGSPGKHQGTTTITEVRAQTFQFSPNPSQTCRGDSGGPAFAIVDGVETLIGATSSGDLACEDHGRDMRVDVYVADFVRPYLERTSPGSAATGERCFYPEHCAAGDCVAAHDEPSITYCAPRCAAAADCPAEMECAEEDLHCRFPAPTPGTIGSACQADGDCHAGTFCLGAGEAALCTRRCIVDGERCPDGFSCAVYREHPERRACLPGADGEGGSGCRVAAGSSRPRSPSLPILLVGVTLAAWKLRAPARAKR